MEAPEDEHDPERGKPLTLAEEKALLKQKLLS
jgi:hypothetical protein